jgi:hypothetical protein
LEDVVYPPPPHAHASVALEVSTLSGAGLSSSARPCHNDALDLALDTTVNIIEELGLSQFDDDAPFAPM